LGARGDLGERRGGTGSRAARRPARRRAAGGREYVFSRFPPEQVWWVGGYALGIALPPNWVGHTYLSNDAFEPFTWEPGYVTNYENVLFGWDNHVCQPDERRTGYTPSYMETLLMTEHRLQVLSQVP